ncbi:hypothetical protein [Micromonospora sp. WMMC250]|uniref:hypothetical protein n=1 Tax=Micromonospora sp. WMMC250 TaxID=3014781 RepID=UPI0022B7332D|nr:hypothetical protein [Micromonospora sp. WMMC250]MCZ7373402.1 hypothetical protein [Micromonospora sp. WMMC250]
MARLGNSSFLMRGWTLTIVTALLALLTTRFQPWLAAAGLVPLTAFWFLDGYFLWQERLFRALYDDVITATSSVPLMSMDLRPYTQVRTWRDATFSRTLALFYVPLGLLNVALVAAAVIAP